MRFGNVIMAYFVIGAFMWGGGAIQWEESGVGQLIISDVNDDRIQQNEQTSGDLENLGGPIRQAASTIGGGALLAIWNILVKFFSYFFWPIVALQSVNAPFRIVVVIGGGFTMAMLVGALRMIRGSA